MRTMKTIKKLHSNTEDLKKIALKAINAIIDPIRDFQLHIIRMTPHILIRFRLPDKCLR